MTKIQLKYCLLLLFFALFNCSCLRVEHHFKSVPLTLEKSDTLNYPLNEVDSSAHFVLKYFEFKIIKEQTTASGQKLIFAEYLHSGFQENHLPFPTGAIRISSTSLGEKQTIVNIDWLSFLRKSLKGKIEENKSRAIKRFSVELKQHLAHYVKPK